MELEKNSPFQPGKPVSPQNFEGRIEIIQDYTRYINQSVYGDSQHFFITGKRGMGKSSLASYLKECAKKKYKMVGVHVYNDGVHTTEDLISEVIERILNEIQDESWSDKIINKFEEYIESVSFLGTTIKLKPNSKDLIKNIKDNFATFLVELTNNFPDKKGIFIIIDDINGLTHNEEFVNWYKSFADTLASSYSYKAPITMVLCGYPEKLESFYKLNPSFNRIFKHKFVESLSKYEVEDFFLRNFNNLGISIDEVALNHMVHFSSGLPIMMQEIGHGVFWINESSRITEKTALLGIIRAGQEIGIKYLKPALDSSIRSEKYLEIFNKLGQDALGHLNEDYSFKKKDFSSKLDEYQKRVFSDFLRKARELGIIEFSGAKKSGHYKFTNNLYLLFFAIQYLEHENKQL